MLLFLSSSTDFVSSTGYCPAQHCSRGNVRFELRRLSGDCQPLAAYQAYLRTHAHVLWSQGIDTTPDVLNLIGLAIFPTMIAMLTIALSTRLIGPTKTSVLGAFEPVTAILVGTLVFGEPLTVNILAGIVICIAAVLFMILSEK